MKPPSLCSTFAATTFSLLCIIHYSSSQIVGCNGNGVDCPERDTDIRSGVCSYTGKQDGIGIVSFESNITSDGPLTWTMTEGDQTPKNSPFSYRGFYLGSPPSLNFQNVTDFGACALILGGNITSDLQLPSGFTDLENFGCDTVMGDVCARDIVIQVREELLSLLNDSSYDPSIYPCTEVGRRLESISYPESCGQALRAQQFSYQDAITLTNDTELTPSMYQVQDNCSLTTGGSDYNMVQGSQDTIFGKSNSEAVKRFKNGTSALLTLFYNEPWNKASTGPVLFLDEPEVHLSCLRKAPTDEQQHKSSGAVSLQVSFRRLDLLFAVLGGLLWLAMMV